MKKLLLAAAIAASPMVMSAEVVNPQELTEKQEAWLDKHRKGHRAFGRDWDNHGVLGSIFWIRVSDKYYSTAVRNLATNADRMEFLGKIQEEEIAEHQAVVNYVNNSIKINKIESDIDAIEEQIDLAKEMVSLQNALELVGGENKDLQAKIDEIKTKLEPFLSDKQELQTVQEQVQTVIDHHKNTIDNLKTIKANLETDKAKLEKAKTDLETDNKKLTTTNTNLETTNKNLETTNKNLETTNKNLETDKANLEKANTNLEKANADLETDKANLEKAIEDLEKDIAKIETTNADLEKAIEDLEKDIAKLENTLEAVNNTDYESEKDAVNQTGQQIADYLNTKDKVSATWDAEAETNKLTVDLSEFWDDYDAVKEKLEPFLSEKQELLPMVEQVQAAIDAHGVLIDHLKDELDEVKEAKKEAEAKLNGEIGELKEALGDYANAQEAYDAGVKSVDITSDNEEVIAQALKDARDAALETLEDKLDDLNISVSGYTDPTVEASASGSHAWGTGQNMYLGSISVKDNNGKYITYNFDGKPANDTWYQINLGEVSAISEISQAEIDTILAVAEAAYKHGYEDGYNDGYKEGYADGYEQGFTDGVNSVK